jgi:hypothetical protein
VKRARVAVAVAVTGLAAVLGSSLLTPSGGASPALPSLVSDNPVNYTPVISGNACLDVDVADATCRRVQDLVRIGDRIYLGGVIDSVTDKTTGATGTYGNAMAFNPATGAVSTSFRPRFTGATGSLQDGQVNAVERSTGGTALWFGGVFKQVNGVTNRGLIRWDVAGNKQYTPFNARIGADGKTARVYDVKYFCGRLWVAGDFTSAGGISRTALVSLNPDTGAATGEVNMLIGGTAGSNSGPTRVTKIAPSPDCKRVVVIGNFTQIANHVRYQVAVINVSPTGGRALLAGWNSSHLAASSAGVGGAGACGGTALTVWPRDVDWAPDGTWWALAGTGGDKPYPALCDSVSRWTNNDSTNAEPVWINYTGGDTFLSVRAAGQYVYVGGHFKALDHVVYRQGVRVASTDHEHFGLGVLAATFSSGMSVSGWNDGATTGRGAGWGAMLVNPGPNGSASGLWVGGDADTILGETGKRIALLPLFP